jgi:hypothetical protein
MDGGDEKETQAETAATVSVAVGDDFEAFEQGDDVFRTHAFAGDGSVSFLVACGQRILFAALFGHVCLGVPFLQALIAAIDNDFRLRMEMKS